MSADPISDLLVAIAGGDRQALRSLYSQTGAKLMGLCLRILKDRQDAEDAVQEVMTRVWLKARGYDAGKGAGLAWLVTMARNLCIDRLRARAPISDDETALDLAADDAPGVETRLIAQGEARRIGDCFQTLEPDRAQAVRSAYLEGLSYQDLALRHDVPLNTMRTWLRRSLLRLRECMEA